MRKGFVNLLLGDEVDDDDDDDDVNLLLGDEIDSLVDLAEATSADLSRHFPSLLDINMKKMPVLRTLTTTTRTVMTTSQ